MDRLVVSAFFAAALLVLAAGRVAVSQSDPSAVYTFDENLPVPNKQFSSSLQEKKSGRAESSSGSTKERGKSHSQSYPKEHSPSSIQHMSCCPGIKEYLNCGTACPPTCKNPKPRFCTLQCVQGCFCPPGYVNDDGECVKPEQCPSVICQLPPETGPCKGAFPRYYYWPGSGSCEKFTYGGCKGNNNNFHTLDECMEKCQDYEPPKEELPPIKECPGLKEFKSCGTACPPTCENPNPLFCILPCVQGCFCPLGYVDDDGECIKPEQCPNVICQLPPETGPCKGAFPRYYYCPASGSCEKFTYGGCKGNRNNFHTLDECMEKCQDYEPPKEELPPIIECPGLKEFKSCGTACPPTCENPNPLFCILPCVQGCFCPPGYVDDDGECIKPEQCPNVICQLPPETGPCKGAFPRYYYCPASGSCEKFTYGGCKGNNNNFHTLDECMKKCQDYEPPKEELPPIIECPGLKEFKSCGTACPPTCDNPNPLFCILLCVPGCFCPPGYVDDDGECVKPEQCPNVICQLPPETGPCQAAFKRYYYCPASGSCKPFTYGGCKGNKNNFYTLDECMEVCKGTKK